MRLVFGSVLCLALAGCGGFGGSRDGGGGMISGLFSRSDASAPVPAAVPEAAPGQLPATAPPTAARAIGARAPLSAPLTDGVLYPGETSEMRALVNEYAARHGIPATLLHRVIQRESDYRADARAGPYYGLMQILPQTARTMGFQGEANDLLDPRVNLEYAGRYLRGAWMVSDGDEDAAIGWYARGYYYEARDRCMIVATGLGPRETAPQCR